MGDSVVAALGVGMLDVAVCVLVLFGGQVVGRARENRFGLGRKVEMLILFSVLFPYII